MENFDRKKHWESVYSTKQLQEVSWYQQVPQTSLSLIGQTGLPFNAKIIDVGGGDSLLAENLLDLGYTDITVLDISEAVINRAKERLGEKAKRIKWIVSDITQFNTTEKYDLWHDRATFHFLTSDSDVVRYTEIAQKNINDDGHLIIGTFSPDGPEKCSGIPIRQYSEESLTNALSGFKRYFSRRSEHLTPANKSQNFVFCCFTKSKK